MQQALYVLAMVLFLFACGDNEPEPIELPTLSMDSLTIQEENTQHPVYLTLRMDKVSYDTVVAIVQSEDISATGDSDYKKLSNYPIEFLPGDVQNNLKLEIFGDEEFEEDESFLVRFVAAQNANFEDKDAVITLLNDDIDTTLVIPSTGYVSPLERPGMELIWQDEFDVGENIEQNWTFETGGGGWGNNELQYYRKDNATIREGGYFVIEAREENYSNRKYTSSRLITRDKFEFKYGRVDIRANLPYGQGIWPALWMLGHNISAVGWPACGEIDIMELVGSSPGTTHGTIHWLNSGDHAQYGGHKKLSSGTFNDEFHVFSITWDEQRIKWYLDDVQFFEADITPAELSEFHNANFFIFNLAVGGNWPGSPNQSTLFPQRLIVDYIRVFQ